MSSTEELKGIIAGLTEALRLIERILVTGDFSKYAPQLKLALLEQQCTGDWSISVIAMAKRRDEFSEKTAQEQYNFIISVLQAEFEEARDAKCGRLSNELSYLRCKRRMNQWINSPFVSKIFCTNLKQWGKI